MAKVISESHVFNRNMYTIFMSYIVEFLAPSFPNKYPSYFAIPCPIKRAILSMQFTVRFSRFLRAYKTVLILLAECLPHTVARESAGLTGNHTSILIWFNWHYLRKYAVCGIYLAWLPNNDAVENTNTSLVRHKMSEEGDGKKNKKRDRSGEGGNALKQHLSCLFTRSLEEKLADLICSMGHVYRV